jgi:hypothetical protein
MRTSNRLLIPTLIILISIAALPGRRSFASKSQSEGEATRSSNLALDTLEGLDIRAVPGNGGDPVKVTSDVATYRGRRAVHLVNDDRGIVKGNRSGGESLAIVKGSEFKDGTIEVDLVGIPRQGSPPDTRGFIGIAFRVQENGARFEAFYVRFTNGRSDDQLRRNHTTQYISEPEFPWFRLREENPGKYESYVDVEEKAWTKLKVVVKGIKAFLYVNGSQQPCLVVNDLKLGKSHGQVALWNGSDTEAYFSRLKISQ